MSDLEKYMNADDELDVLIRAGLIHYQFETIHPFLDGNGRVGRLLITLFLRNIWTSCGKVLDPGSVPPDICLAVRAPVRYTVVDRPIAMPRQS
jgi:fido (protein-threonine AMPylation protein)